MDNKKLKNKIRWITIAVGFVISLGFMVWWQYQCCPSPSDYMDDPNANFLDYLAESTGFWVPGALISVGIIIFSVILGFILSKYIALAKTVSSSETKNLSLEEEAAFKSRISKFKKIKYSVLIVVAIAGLSVALWFYSRTVIENWPLDKAFIAFGITLLLELIIGFGFRIKKNKFADSKVVSGVANNDTNIIKTKVMSSIDDDTISAVKAKVINTINNAANAVKAEDNNQNIDDINLF